MLLSSLVESWHYQSKSPLEKHFGTVNFAKMHQRLTLSPVAICSLAAEVSASPPIKRIIATMMIDWNDDGVYANC